MIFLSFRRLSLSFDGAARHAFHVVALHTDEQRDDNRADDAGACAKDGKVVVETILFRINHLIQPQRNGVLAPLGDYGIDEDKVAPRRDKRRQHRVHDNRLCHRQN